MAGGGAPTIGATVCPLIERSPEHAFGLPLTRLSAIDPTLAGYGDGYGDGGGFLGLGSGVDLSFLLGAGMLASMVYRLGGGGRPGGWSVGNFIHGVQNLDFFQMMMFVNLIQNVLGGGRRRGMGMPYGGFGRRGMYY